MIMVVGVRMGVGTGDGASGSGAARLGGFDLHLRYPYAVMS